MPSRPWRIEPLRKATAMRASSPLNALEQRGEAADLVETATHGLHGG